MIFTNHNFYLSVIVLLGLTGFGLRAETFGDWKFEAGSGFLDARGLNALTMIEKDGKVPAVDTDTALESAAQFDGETYIASEETFSWAHQNFTVEVLFKTGTLKGDNVLTLVGQWNADLNLRGWLVGIKKKQVFILFDKKGGRSHSYEAFSLREDTVYYVAMVKSEKTLTVYLKNITEDGTMVKKEYFDLPRTLAFASLPLTMGATSTPSAYFNGLIGRIKIHTDAKEPVQLLWGN